MQRNDFNGPAVSEPRPRSGTANKPRVYGPERIPTSLNLLLISIVVGGTLFQLFVMPSLLRTLGMRAAWFLLPITLLQPLHWGLIHEAIHSHLLPKRRFNDFCARLLSILHGLPFDATRFGHLVHHRFSRHAYDRPDVYDGRGTYAVAWLRYRGRLFGGVYLGLFLVPLIAFLPVPLGVRLVQNAIRIEEASDVQVRRLFASLVMNVPKRRRTRREFALMLVLYGASAWAYGASWPMLLATMYLRGIWHSFADNVPHHGVALDELQRARNYALPQVFGLLVMNHHLHLTHHLYPTAPWRSLAGLRVPGDDRPRENYFWAALRQSNPRYPGFSRGERLSLMRPGWSVASRMD